MEASFFFCCTAIDGELDLTVHSPRRIPALIGPQLPLRRRMIDSPTKPILKDPNSSATLLFPKYVRFSLNSEVALIDPSKAFLFEIDYDSEDFSPIILRCLIDYSVEEGKTIQTHLAENEFSDEITNLIRTNFASLIDFPMKFKDLAGLFLLVCFCQQPIEFYKTSNLSAFIKYFPTAFPDCDNLIDYIKITLVRYKITRGYALAGLLKIAFDNDLVYTIESLYAILGDVYVGAFLKNSVIVNSMRLFLRFHADFPNFPNDKIISWAIEYGNCEIYEKFIQFIDDFESIKKSFEEPIIVYIAKKMFYFPGIVEKLFTNEMGSFEDALSLSIFSGNYKLFKDLIKYDNEVFPEHDKTILDILRSVLDDNPSENNTEYSPQIFTEEILLILLRLDSDSSVIMNIFISALSDIISSDFSQSIFLITIFLRTRNYFKIILNSFYSGSGPLSFEIIVDDISENEPCKVGISEIVRNSKMYPIIMEEISNMPCYNVLHAIGDPTFPPFLWTKLVPLITDWNLDSYCSYQDLSEDFVFNYETLLLIADFEQLDIWEPRHWNYLDLAVFNINPTAVNVILSHSNLDIKSISSALNDAKQLLNFFQTQNNAPSILYPVYFCKQRISRHFHSMFPDFYMEKEDSSLFTVEKFVYKLKIDANIIVSKIEDYLLLHNE